MYTLAVSTSVEASMKEIQKAKFFKTGGSKALRIPASVFAGVEEVWLRWDESSQTLTITKRNPKPFEEFFQLLEKLGPAPDEITEELAEIRREIDAGFADRAKRLDLK
jgi:virulence-associated protein VagC